MNERRIRRASATATLLLFAACATGPERREVRHSNGALAQAGETVAGRQEGEWTFWYPSGAMQARGLYANDARTGQWTHWHANGQVHMTGAYRHDRQDGLWQFWHENGALHCRGEFQAGREHGEWTFGHASGKVQQRGCFADGRRVLHWDEFGADGRPRSAGSYLDDQPVGRWTRWDEHGAATELDYPMSVGCRLVAETWDDDSIRRQGFLRDGRPAGLWVSRHRGGSLRAIVSFDGGEPCGEFRTWREDGSPLARGPLGNGRPTGRWQLRDRDGEHWLDVAPEPRAPWDRQWSDAALADRSAPLLVAARWLDELTSPLDVAPLPDAVPSPPDAVPTEPSPERLEAPTDPGVWTIREREELHMYRRYYRDGWLPRRGGGTGYTADISSNRFGSGDAALAQGIVGGPLPVTRFRTGDGGSLDLSQLRGKRVLFVVLRGFTTQVCVYCFAQTAELVPMARRLAALDCEVVVMFPGSRSRLDAFVSACAEEFGGKPLPYRMIYDPDLDLARALGLQGNLARPSSFVLDEQGTVRFAYVAESEINIADRPSAQQLVEQVERIR